MNFRELLPNIAEAPGAKGAQASPEMEKTYQNILITVTYFNELFAKV